MKKEIDINELSKIPFEQIFCDSHKALNIAYENGLNQQVKVLTSSPWLLNIKNKNVEHLESKLIGKKLKMLQKSVFPFTLKIYKSLSDSCFKNERLISSQNGLFFNRLLRKAACLKNEDKYKESLILRIDTGNHELNENINTKWERLFLPNNFKFKTLKIRHPNELSFKKKNYSYFDLINLYSFENLYYFFFKKFKKLFSFDRFEKQIIIFREDNLTREICYHLIKKGIEPIFYKNQKIEKLEFCKKKFLKIRNILEPLVTNYSRKWVCKNFMSEIVNHYFYELKRSLDLKKSYNSFFKEYFSQFKKKILCITSYPSLPKLIGLAETMKEKQIKLVATQHGINREINDTYKEGSSTMENGVSDILFCNNNESKKISDKSPFVNGISYVVGTPKQISIKKKVNLQFFRKKIFYISTRISAANVNMLNGYLTDYERVNQELKLIKEVFSNTHKKIIYKTYPTLDYYIDEDPVHFEILKTKNMELLKTPRDNQFFFSEMKLIITSRATSTLSSCLFSKVPIVFINYPNQYMVKKKITNLLKKSLFYFDASEEDFFKKLLSQIERTSQSIYKEWKFKEKDRNKFINQYISSFQGNEAGKFGAEYLLKNNLFNRYN